jgi:hypothetical protein
MIDTTPFANGNLVRQDIETFVDLHRVCVDGPRSFPAVLMLRQPQSKLYAQFRLLDTSCAAYNNYRHEDSENDRDIGLVNKSKLWRSRASGPESL